MVEVMIWAAQRSMPPDNRDNRDCKAPLSFPAGACVTDERATAREAR